MISREPAKLGDLIADSLNRLGLSSRVQRQAAVIGWKEAVGEIIARESEAVKIDGHTLVVRVHRSAWRHEMTFLKTQILSSLERNFGKGCVKDIRFI